jgi:hypothetical protein
MIERLTRLKGQPQEPIQRDAEFAPASYDPPTRTMDLEMSTGARGVRFDWWTGLDFEEELSMEPGAVNLDRANNHAPFLDCHRSWTADNVLGKLIPGSVRVESGKLVGRVQFAADDELDEYGKRTIAKIISGTLRNLSIGYNVQEWERIRAKDRDDDVDMDLYRAVRWEVYECSIVPMGFDDAAKTRGLGGDKTPMNKELNMGLDRDKALAPSAPAEPVVPNGGSIDEAAIREEARKAATEAEKARVSGILMTARKLRIDDSVSEKLITDGVDLEAARAKMIDIHAERSEKAAPISGSFNIDTGGAELDKLREGLVESVANRLDGRMKLTDNGRRFARHSLTDLGRELLGAAGVRVTGSRHELIERMLTRSTHSTSDFPNLFLDAVNKTLADTYKEIPRNWLPLSSYTPASDFKSIHAIQMGAMPDFREIPEGADYEDGTLVDARESYALKTYGRALTLSRQMLINDDLGAFANTLRGLMNSAARHENGLFWSWFTANKSLGDGTALFHTTRGNTATSADAPSASTIDIGFQAIMNQKALGESASPLNIEPGFIIVPPNYRATVDNILNGKIVPGKAADNIPSYLGALVAIVEARINAAQWYLATSPDVYPNFHHSYLAGAEGFQTEEIEVSRQQGIRIGAWIDFAVAATDFRGLYRNAAS